MTSLKRDVPGVVKSCIFGVSFQIEQVSFNESTPLVKQPPKGQKVFLKLNKLNMIERLCRIIYLHLSFCFTLVGNHCLDIKAK